MQITDLMMLETLPLPNGAHQNQTFHGTLPEGWALLPPGEYENFPFGEVTVAAVEGVPTVTGWTPLPIPEPAPEPEAQPDFTPETLAAAIREGVSAV